MFPDYAKSRLMVLHRYSHISIYSTVQGYTAKEMPLKSSNRNNRKKQAITERTVNSENVVSQEINIKEVDKPIYLKAARMPIAFRYGLNCVYHNFKLFVVYSGLCLKRSGSGSIQLRLRKQF